MVAGSFGKQIDHLLSDSHIIRFAEGLPGVGRELGQIGEGLHEYWVLWQFC